MALVFSKSSPNIFEWGGSGKIYHNDIFLKDVHWNLLLSISGDVSIELSYQGGLLRQLLVKEDFSVFSMTGITNDENWTIACKELSVSSFSINSNGNQTLSTFLNYDATIEIYSDTFNEKTYEQCSVKSHLINFNFSLGNSLLAKSGVDSFTCNMNEIVFFNFVLYDEAKSKITPALNDKIINKAFLSTVSYKYNMELELEDNLSETWALCELLSIFSGNLISSPISELLVKNETVGYIISDPTSNNYDKSNQVISCLYAEKNLKLAIESCYPVYKKLRENLQLNKFSSFFVSITDAYYYEIKLATLILCYEFFLFTYLSSRGESGVNGMNIQSKINKTNKYLNFIPSNIADTMRSDLRNPLFHTGQLPLLTGDELFDYFVQYNDLLKIILLSILEYDGNFYSSTIHKNIGVATAKKNFPDL